MKNRYTKLKKDTFILMIGNFSAKCLQFLMLPVYTRVLSTSDYGIADLIITISNLLYPVFSINIAESVLRFMLDDKEDKRKIFYCACIYLLLSISLTVMMTIGLSHSETFSRYRFLLLFYLISNTFYLTISAYVKGLDKTEKYAWASVISAVACVGMSMVLLVIFHKGIYGYMISFIISFIFASIYLLWTCRTEIIDSISLHITLDLDLLMRMFFYALPMIPNSISWWISNSSDKFIIKMFYNTAAVGIYSAAYKIPAVVGVICNNFIAAWQLSSVEGFGTKQTEKFYNRIYKVFTLLITIFTGCIIEFSQLITRFFIGEKFFEAWRYIPILMIGVLFCNASAFLGSVFTAGKATKYLFYSTSVGAIVNILLNIVLIPLIGISGAAVATAISYIIIWGYRIYKSKRKYNLKFLNGRELCCYTLLVLQAYFVINETKIYLTLIPLLLILGLVGIEVLQIKMTVKKT